MSHKVLVVRANPIAPDVRVERWVNYLSENGWSVQVYGLDRKWILPRESFIGQVNVKRCRLLKEGKGKIAHRLNYLLWFLWLIYKALFGKYSIVHACDFDSFAPALLGAKISRKKIVYDIFDLYSDLQINLPRRVRKWINWIDFKLMRKADVVVLADKSRFNQIKTHRLKRVVVIYNTPPDLLEEFSRSAIETPDSGKIRIVYLGLLDRKKRDIDYILDLVSEESGVELVVYGGGRDYDYFATKARNIENVSVYGKVDYKAALWEEYKSDLILAIYNPEIGNNIFASPNKLFEGMMLGKPVLMNKELISAQLIEDNACGFTFKFRSREEFKDLIDKLKRDPAAMKKAGQNGRKLYERDFRYEHQASKLEDIYRVLLDR